MSVLKQIRSLYNDLKPVQKKIADYFMHADFNDINLSIEDIAKNVGTSVASISRFCKRLDYQSFQHFKIVMSRDLKYEPEMVLPIFKMDDDPQLAIRKVFSEIITNLQATEGTVELSCINRAVDKMLSSSMVYLFGLGGSGGVGYLGELLFSHLGINCASISEPYRMIVKAGHSVQNTLIIGLSHSGRTRYVVDAVKMGKNNGAFTIGISNYRHSPLAEETDLTLLTACHERRVHFAQSDSMMAQFALLRVLYILAASRSSEAAVQRVNTIEESVSNSLRTKK
ncbi:MAG: MurR/RpiR family transcriptional regulator [Spirochaetota bacterium]